MCGGGHVHGGAPNGCAMCHSHANAAPTRWWHQRTPPTKAFVGPGMATQPNFGVGGLRVAKNGWAGTHGPMAGAWGAKHVVLGKKKFFNKVAGSLVPHQRTQRACGSLVPLHRGIVGFKCAQCLCWGTARSDRAANHALAAPQCRELRLTINNHLPNIIDKLLITSQQTHAMAITNKLLNTFVDIGCY